VKICEGPECFILTPVLLTHFLQVQRIRRENAVGREHDGMRDARARAWYSSTQSWPAGESLSWPVYIGITGGMWPRTRRTKVLLEKVDYLSPDQTRQLAANRRMIIRTSPSRSVSSSAKVAGRATGVRLRFSFCPTWPVARTNADSLTCLQEAKKCDRDGSRYRTRPSHHGDLKLIRLVLCLSTTWFVVREIG